jgi:hypothetical protein
VGCCKPILHAWFKSESLFKLGLRHTIDCLDRPGEIDGLVKGAWRSQGRKLRTGEVYS